MSKQLLSLTNRCIRQIISKCKENDMLRVTVNAGGCNGFSYNYKFDSELSSDDIVIEYKGAKVVTDSTSSEFLGGSVIDYHDEMIRSGFIIDINPNVESACSCKVSFSLKD